MAGGVVLVAQDCFPSLHSLLAELAQQIGFVLRTVAPSGDRAYVTDDEMVAAWGPDVRLALLIWVTSTTSHRCDLDRLLAHGRMRGSLVGNKDFHFAIYRAAGNPVLVGQFEKLWLRAGAVPAFCPKSCCSDIRPGAMCRSHTTMTRRCGRLTPRHGSWSGGRNPPRRGFTCLPCLPWSDEVQRADRGNGRPEQRHVRAMQSPPLRHHRHG